MNEHDLNPAGGRAPAWRRDFPIDWPRQHYVARRDFTRFLALASLPFAAGQLWMGVHNWFRRARSLPPVRPIARLDQLPVGGALAFDYPEDDPCLLVRTDEHTLLAYSQKCTHLGCALVPESEAGRLHCPCHHGYFDLATGRALAGPPRRPLSRVRLETRGGIIYATGLEVTPV